MRMYIKYHIYHITDIWVGMNNKKRKIADIVFVRNKVLLTDDRAQVASQSYGR